MRVVYTRLLFWADGFALCPGLVFIHPNFRHDAGLLVHEKRHAEQMREAGTLAWWWKYLTCKDCRLNAEVDAYRAQLAMNPEQIGTFARHLCERYYLEISFEAALAFLQSSEATENEHEQSSTTRRPVATATRRGAGPGC